jgi:prevent-host-death family protein
MSAPTWNIAEALARFSEVLQNARDVPQVIESSGEAVAVVLGISEFRELKALKEQAASEARLAQFLRFSEALRAEGGCELDMPDRLARPSPFTGEDER